MSKKNKIKTINIIKVGSEERPAGKKDIKKVQKSLKKACKKAKKQGNKSLMIVTHHAFQFETHYL